MNGIETLLEGYRDFRRHEFRPNESRYRELASRGQSPVAAVISCCDSRVDPATIFGAGPGGLFTVRNVANLVPPCEAAGRYHATSAALEFAVETLKVPNIIVLGHSRCGGIESWLETKDDAISGGGFIGEWISLLDGMSPPGESDGAAVYEQAAVIRSIGNLKSFPFINGRLADGALNLYGGWFDIASGALFWLDRDSGQFLPVSD